MSQQPGLDSSPLSDTHAHHEHLLDSPEAPNGNPSAYTSDPTPSRHPRPDTQARDAALQKELEAVRSVNTVVENLINGLQKAKGNMQTVHNTVQSASTLLNTWTRILSQTEHNQRLILNPNWQGATQDLEDIENEAAMRQQAAERRAAEDQARREATARRAEEEDRRSALAPTTVRTTRGRVRPSGATRSTAHSTPASTTPTTYVGVGGQGGRGRATSKLGSGIGRGTRGTRGRGLG